MCLAIPMQVIRMDGAMAVCQGPDGETRLDTLLTGPLAGGDWVLGFLGAAREVIDAGRAGQIGDAVAALRAILAGDGSPDSIDAVIKDRFADLVGREPALPDFLRPAAA